MRVEGTTRRVGLIGGIAPESTIQYYRLILAGYRSRRPGGGYPSLLINSIDLERMLAAVTAGDRSALVDYLVDEIKSLERAGAQFGAMLSNTPHLVFDEIQARSAIPLVSLVAATRDAAKRLGLARLGLFGTRFTMEARFYAEALSPVGIEVVAPQPDERAYIHEKYMTELVSAVAKDETRRGLLAIAEALREREAIDGLILGGTELSLILGDLKATPVPFLDTARIHAAAIVERLLA